MSPTSEVDGEYVIGLALGLALGIGLLAGGAYLASMPWAAVEPPWSWPYMVGLGTMSIVSKGLPRLGQFLERGLP